MTSETTYGREPIQIVELEQKRCGLRYGNLPCRAAIAPFELRTNQILWSQDLTNAVWNVANRRGSFTVGATAPDNTATATTYVEDTATGIRQIAQFSLSFVSGLEYVFSAYAKQGAGSRHIGLGLPNAAFGTGAAVVFNLSTGAATITLGAGVTAGAVLVNGYWRCWVKQTATATASAAIAWRMSNSATTYGPSYTGDGTSSIVVWGFQLEAGSAVSTYQVTGATAESRVWGTGAAKCYNTYWTCQDRERYDPTGSIKWRFTKPRAGVLPLYSEVGNDIATDPIYMLTGVSTAPSRINLGSSRDGESPFGVRGQITVNLQDAPWQDHVGDYYVADRAAPVDANFWALMNARNPFWPDARLRVYEGYIGQALGDMQTRLYLMNGIDGPDAGGGVTLRGSDPLQLADKKRAQFPRATDIRLKSAILATGGFTVIATETDLTDAYGNTGTRRFLRVGSEIIEYTGHTGTAPEFTLTGVRRGQLGTVAATHAEGDGCQRVGRYEDELMYRVAYDLITGHTLVDASFIDLAQWDAEGGSFLGTFRTTATVPSPTDVEKLVGELCRDGLFSMWWDERAQTIPLLAVRPPQETPVALSDSLNILAGSPVLQSRPDDRLTRVTILYNQADPTKGVDDVTNYFNRRILIDGEVETPNATGGEIREKMIYSRWINTEAQAFLCGAQLVLRYRNIPRYLSIKLDAKDRAITIGDVVDVTSRVVINADGTATQTRWQVISLDETKPGDTIALDLQSYTFIGKFAVIMPNDAPPYDDATEAERLDGCWLADDATLKMPDGSEPYLLQ